MILFLNFAPIDFMGGMERWIYKYSQKLNDKEPTEIITASPQIANIYGKLVLKQDFNKRLGSDEINKNNIHDLSLLNFIPFTSSWIKSKRSFSKARLIYAKYELIEILIILYFLGFQGFKKTVVGLHTPFIYQETNTYFDKLHKLLYESRFSKVVLKKMKLVHVINKRDKKFLQSKFLLSNVVYIPNGTKSNSTKTEFNDIDQLKILFVGELSIRKGVDVLINVIEKSSRNYCFQIIGNGVLKSEVENLSIRCVNCKYLGYMKNDLISSFYQKSDILFQP